MLGSSPLLGTGSDSELRSWPNLWITRSGKRLNKTERPSTPDSVGNVLNMDIKCNLQEPVGSVVGF